MAPLRLPYFLLMLLQSTCQHQAPSYSPKKGSLFLPSLNLLTRITSCGGWNFPLQNWTKLHDPHTSSMFVDGIDAIRCELTFPIFCLQLWFFFCVIVAIQTKSHFSNCLMKIERPGCYQLIHNFSLSIKSTNTKGTLLHCLVKSGSL